MSKIKLRKKSLKDLRNSNLLSGSGFLNRNGLPYRYDDRSTVKLVTNFSNRLNFTYLNAIVNYYLLNFSKHNLWVEIVDANTSSLYVRWNMVNPKIVKDLTPFWEIFDAIRDKDLYAVNPKVNNSSDVLNEVFQNIYNTYEYQEEITTKEKYLAYRKRNKENTDYHWWLKKMDAIGLKQESIYKKHMRNKRNKGIK